MKLYYKGFNDKATKKQAQKAEKLAATLAARQHLEGDVSLEARSYPGLFGVGTKYAVHLEVRGEHSFISADSLARTLPGAVKQAFDHLDARLATVMTA